MTSRGTRRWVLAVALTLTAFLLPLARPGPAAAAVTPSPRVTAATPTAEPPEARTAGRATGRDAVSITVTALEPKAPRATDILTISGTLTNHGREDFAGPELRLLVGPRLSSRSALAAATTNPPATRHADPGPLLTAPLPAGQSTTFTYRAPATDLALGDLGVYPLRLEAHSRSGAMVGAVDTFLPWLPDQVAAPTRLAWVWPLVDAPHRASDRQLLDDGLAQQFERGQRLDGLLAAARDAGRPQPPSGPASPGPTPVPVTWAVDPDLLDTAALMSTLYDVRTPDGHRRPGSGTTAATEWLAGVRAATRAQPVVALPYADPDISAVARAGLDGDIAAALTLGRDVVGSTLGGARLLPTLAWPPGGLVSPAAADALVTAGTRSLLLDEAALPLRRLPCCSTADARTTVRSSGQSLDALVVDGGLSGLLGAAPTPGGPRLAEQRFLAETAMISAERRDSRTVVVAPPRRWAPDPAYAAAVLADTGSVPWLRPITVADALATPPGDPDRPSLVYPARAASDELPPSQLVAIDRIRTSMREFRSSLAGDEALLPVRLGLFRAESTAGRTDLPAAVTLRDQVQAALLRMRSRVRVSSTGRVTLTSRRGAIPVTLANDLDQPVSVLLRLDARNQARLRTRGGAVQTLAAHSSKQLELQAEALTSGQFTVYVTLLTLDGHQLGDRATLLVRSTAYGRVAVGITGTALGLLLVAIGAQVTRRALRGREPAQATTPVDEVVRV